MVECQLPKLDVAGSSPVARSTVHASIERFSERLHPLRMQPFLPTPTQLSLQCAECCAWGSRSGRAHGPLCQSVGVNGHRVASTIQLTESAFAAPRCRRDAKAAQSAIPTPETMMRSQPRHTAA